MAPYSPPMRPPIPVTVFQRTCAAAGAWLYGLKHGTSLPVDDIHAPPIVYHSRFAAEMGLVQYRSWIGVSGQVCCVTVVWTVKVVTGLSHPM